MKASRIIVVSLLAGILILPRPCIAASLWGDSHFLPRGAMQINLYCQLLSETTETLALKSLAGAVQSYPKAQHFRVRWAESFSSGWTQQNQAYIDYDRTTQELVEVINDPTGDRAIEQWSKVRASLLPGLAKNGFQSHYLTVAGCKSELP